MSLLHIFDLLYLPPCEVSELGYKPFKLNTFSERMLSFYLFWQTGTWLKQLQIRLIWKTGRRRFPVFSRVL